MKYIYIVTIQYPADFFEDFFHVHDYYFTSESKAIKWLESKGFKHLVEDEYIRQEGYSIQHHAQVKVLLNSEEDTNND